MRAVVLNDDFSRVVEAILSMDIPDYYVPQKITNDKLFQVLALKLCEMGQKKDSSFSILLADQKNGPYEDYSSFPGPWVNIGQFISNILFAPTEYSGGWFPKDILGLGEEGILNMLGEPDSLLFDGPSGYDVQGGTAPKLLYILVYVLCNCNIPLEQIYSEYALQQVLLGIMGFDIYGPVPSYSEKYFREWFVRHETWCDSIVYKLLMKRLPDSFDIRGFAGDILDKVSIMGCENDLASFDSVETFYLLFMAGMYLFSHMEEFGYDCMEGLCWGEFLSCISANGLCPYRRYDSCSGFSGHWTLNTLSDVVDFLEDLPDCDCTVRMALRCLEPYMFYYGNNRDNGAVCALYRSPDGMFCYSFADLVTDGVSEYSSLLDGFGRLPGKIAVSMAYLLRYAVYRGFEFEIG